MVLTERDDCRTKVGDSQQGFGGVGLRNIEDGLTSQNLFSINASDTGVPVESTLPGQNDEDVTVRDGPNAQSLPQPALRKLGFQEYFSIGTPFNELMRRIQSQTRAKGRYLTLSCY
jgi:hypothetical protein